MIEGLARDIAGKVKACSVDGPGVLLLGRALGPREVRRQALLAAE